MKTTRCTVCGFTQPDHAEPTFAQHDCEAVLETSCEGCDGSMTANNGGPVIRGCAACCRDCGFPCSIEKDDDGFHSGEVPVHTCPKDGTKVEEGTCCAACGVMAGEPCVECGESMYHREGCNEIGAEIKLMEVGTYSRRYRVEGGVEDEGWRKSLREGKVAWCEVNVHADGTLVSYGGEVWPGAWPSLFTPINPSAALGSGGFTVTEMGLQALRCADKRS